MDSREKLIKDFLELDFDPELVKIAVDRSRCKDEIAEMVLKMMEDQGYKESILTLPKIDYNSTNKPSSISNIITAGLKPTENNNKQENLHNINSNKQTASQLNNSSNNLSPINKVNSNVEQPLPSTDINVLIRKAISEVEKKEEQSKQSLKNLQQNDDKKNIDFNLIGNRQEDKDDFVLIPPSRNSYNQDQQVNKNGFQIQQNIQYPINQNQNENRDLLGLLGNSNNSFGLINKDQNSQSFDLKSLLVGLKNIESFKMVILVRKDLKMGVGKIAAQCSHAGNNLFNSAVKAYKETRSSYSTDCWESQGSAKVVLAVDNLDQLLKLHEEAKALEIHSCIIRDAGRTQVDPGTITVCAIGPAQKSLIDKVTGSLSLY